MDNLRFRKKFNLGITKDISGKKLSNWKNCKVWPSRNVVKHGKYSPTKLANLYIHLYDVRKLVTNLVTNSHT